MAVLCQQSFKTVPVQRSKGESNVEFSETGDTIHVLQLLFTIGDTCSEIVSQFNQVAGHAQTSDN